MENKIHELSTQHRSYLQDTPHFLRIIHKLNQGPKLPTNAVIVTSDVIGAYQNIPQQDGIDCLQETLEERAHKEVPSHFITKLMELTQTSNIFEFNQDLWIQLVGVAMGIHPAPSYANIYLARRLDEKITALGLKYGSNDKSAWLLFKRFLDDLIKIFVGTTKQLHTIFDEMNKIHPTLKFTLNHTNPEEEREEDRCDCEPQASIPFLDTSLSIVNGRIETDLYKKDTDRNQYLLRESCHPAGVTASIPYSLGLRIVRICSKNENRDLRLSELKNILLQRGYPKQLIERGIEKARKVSRKIALLKVKKKTVQNRPIFAVKYDPRLPSIQQIQAKHWRAMTLQNNYLSEVFEEPPLTAYRGQNNLRDMLIKSKVPPLPPLYPRREIRGMAKCGNSCTACIFVKEGKIVKINSENIWKIKRKVNCNTFNCIYMIQCQKDKCKEKYIGQTGRLLKFRIAEQRSYINNQVTSKATGAHFNLPGHSLADMKFTVLEQVKYNDEAYRRERESYHINKFNTFFQGLNREM